MDTEPFDLISALSDRGLYHVVDSVIHFLDVQSLCRFEAVSSLWNSLVQDNRHWKTKYKRAAAEDAPLQIPTHEQQGKIPPIPSSIQVDFSRVT